MRLRNVLAVAALTATACAPMKSAVDPQPTTAVETITLADEAAREFARALEDYVSLHRRMERTIDSLPTIAEPAQVHAHEVALEKAIASARVGAKEGDVFVASIRDGLRQMCRAILGGPDGRALREDIREESSERRLTARVNVRYPDEIPLSAVPHQLLRALPRLPDELEYRFLGKALILLDAEARIVVDILRDAMPR